MRDHVQSVSDLSKRLATGGTGYAVVHNGVLDVGSVSDSRKKAALKGVGRFISADAGLLMARACDDENCVCAEKKFAILVPSAKIVSVKVEVCNG